MIALHLLALALRAAAQSPAPQDPIHLEEVYWDTLDAQGRLTGGRTLLETPRPGSVTSVSVSPVTTYSLSLPPPGTAHRIDLVFVGDGYTASELGLYASQVATIAGTFFNKVPYSTYASYFTVHQVDVVSAESGVDNDPVQGVLKDTAMDMAFWCNGIDRLLCVHVGKANQFANNAPDVDLIAAIANSATYGGAGYPSSDLATCAAGNGASLEIMRHEFGHALGNLADEYDYGGPSTYTGPEPSAANVSKLDAAQMAAAGTKWALWLGTNIAAYDGLISTFEGANYSVFGIYRPTNNSLMRSLNRPFNLPSIERMIVEIYRLVDPIDASSDPSVVYTGNETLFVTPMAPVGHALDVQWSLDGTPIPGATGTTLDLGSLPLGACSETVSVTVTDNTSLVISSALRAQWLTQTLEFEVQVPWSPIQSYCSTSPNSVGPGALIGALGSSSFAANDLVLRATGCPPSKPGLFFFGPNATSGLPFQNGILCVGGGFWRFPPIASNASGTALWSLDVSTSPGDHITAGSMWHFQYWYRDPADPPAGVNLSDALRVRFCP